MEPCQCLMAELRLRTYADGTKHVCEQCMDCGKSIKVLKRSALFDMAVDPSKLKPFDPLIAKRHQEKVQAYWKQQSETMQLNRKREWWANYQAYMDSPAWRAIRAKVLKRDNYICQGCGAAGARHVHHLHYATFGAEMMFDLVSVCVDCHEKIHQRSLRDDQDYTVIR